TEAPQTFFHFPLARRIIFELDGVTLGGRNPRPPRSQPPRAQACAAIQDLLTPRAHRGQSGQPSIPGRGFSKHGGKLPSGPSTVEKRHVSFDSTATPTT